MEELLLILVVASTLIGVKALLHGLRGRRVDDHPVCSACQFDLVGSWPSSKICPECGADLKSAGAVQHGHRRRRRAVAGIGAAMLLAAAALLLFAGFVPEFAINWNALKTDGWLVRDLRSTDAQTAEAALQELVQRDQSDSLSRRNRTVLLDHIYAYFIPQLRTTEVEWSPVVERAWIDGTLSKDRVLQYIQPALGMSFFINEPQEIHKGDVLRFGFSLYPPYGHRKHPMKLEIIPVSSGVGSFVYELNPRSIKELIDPELNSALGSVLWDTPVEVDAGESVVHLKWKINSAIAGHPETAVNWGDSLDQPITVLEPWPDSFTFFNDAQTAKQMRDAIHFDVVGIRRISEDDDRTVVVGTYQADRLDVHASIRLDLTDNNGIVEGTHFPQGVSWGSRHPFHVFVPEGQETESLEFVLFACKEDGPWTSTGPGPVSDRRPLWFGSPVSFRVPIRWVDGPGSEGVSEDIRRELERDARWWRTDEERRENR